MAKKEDKFAIAQREYYAIFGDDADKPSRDHSAIDGTVVTLIPDDEYGHTLAMFIVKDGKAQHVRGDTPLPPEYKWSKVLDLGFMPPDDPLFSRGWIFGGKRLSDVAPEEGQENTARSQEDDEGARPLCADPEDYDLG
jgi:hypothetical protein